MNMILTTERLTITKLTMDMAEVIQRNSLDEDNRRFVPDEVFETVDEARETVSFLISQYGTKDGPLLYPVLISQTGENIGYVQLVPLGGGKWEVGYHIARQHTGRGYAAEAVRAFLPAVTRLVGVDQVEGVCLKENAASIRVLEKCGFQHVFDGPGEYQGEIRPIVKMTWRREGEGAATITLRPITEDNFIDAFHLKLAPGQEAYVSHPIRSLAQAYVYRNQCQPFGIYADDAMVGYVMVIYDHDIPEYDVWHMMIDQSQQGKGYGSAALDRVLDYIRTKPFGTSDKVTLTCNKENVYALRLYHSRGFAETGVSDEDELELSMTLMA